MERLLVDANRILNPYFQLCIAKGDSNVQVIRKKVLMLFYPVIIVSSSLNAATGKFYSMISFAVFGIGTSVLGLVWILAAQHVSEVHLTVTMGLSTLAVMLIDLDYSMQLGSGVDGLQFVVIILDILVVCQSRQSTTSIVQGLLTLWLVVQMVESAYRVGLYDIPMSPSYEERIDVCDCPKPPCAKSITQAGMGLFSRLVMFMLDYFFTRGFAQRMLHGQARIEASAKATECIATSLANFDLQEAGSILIASSEELPPRLHDALTRILHNLEMYRPYLPASILPSKEHGQSDSSSGGRRKSEGSISPSTVKQDSDSNASTPSLQHGEVLQRVRASFVVINMVGSTELVEADPPRFSEMLSCFLDHALSCIRQYRGIPEYFLGDHLHVAYNASRTCSSHCKSAVQTALAFLSGKGTLPTCTVGIASGRVVCGRMGCSDMMSFTVLGFAPLVAQGLERLAREWGRSILCDGKVKEEAVGYTAKLVPVRVKGMRRGQPGKMVTQPVFEVIEGQAADLKVDEDEWMYQLEKLGDAYENHNDTAVKYLNGADWSELESLAINLPSNSTLRDRIQRHEAPSDYVFQF